MKLSERFQSILARLREQRLWSDRTVLSFGNTLRVRLRRLLTLVLLIVGAGLCFRAFRGIDWTVATRDLRHAGPWVILLMVAPAVGNGLHMLGWRALLDPKWRPSLWRSFRIFVAAQAGNEMGASVFGEPIKVVAIPPEGRSTAVRAVVWDNLTSLVALGFVALSLMAVSIGKGTGASLHRALSGAIVLTVVGTGLAWLAQRFRASERPPLTRVGLALGAHYLGKIWVVAEFALALALVAHASLYSCSVLGVASILGSVVGAPIPGQLGAVEEALVSVANLAQVSVSTLLTVAILRRIRSLLWVLLGAGFFMALGRGQWTSEESP